MRYVGSIYVPVPGSRNGGGSHSFCLHFYLWNFTLLFSYRSTLTFTIKHILTTPATIYFSLCLVHSQASLSSQLLWWELKRHLWRNSPFPQSLHIRKRVTEVNTHHAQSTSTFWLQWHHIQIIFHIWHVLRSRWLNSQFKVPWLRT